MFLYNVYYQSQELFLEAPTLDLKRLNPSEYGWSYYKYIQLWMTLKRYQKA